MVIKFAFQEEGKCWIVDFVITNTELARITHSFGKECWYCCIYVPTVQSLLWVMKAFLWWYWIYIEWRLFRLILSSRNNPEDSVIVWVVASWGLKFWLLFCKMMNFEIYVVCFCLLLFSWLTVKWKKQVYCHPEQRYSQSTPLYQREDKTSDHNCEWITYLFSVYWLILWGISGVTEFKHSSWNQC